MDDSHPAVIGWGAVNSQIFDTIAAGALPVTNSTWVSTRSAWRTCRLTPLCKSSIHSSNGCSAILMAQMHSPRSWARSCERDTPSIEEPRTSRRS